MHREKAAGPEFHFASGILSGSRILKFAFLSIFCTGRLRTRGAPLPVVPSFDSQEDRNAPPSDQNRGCTRNFLTNPCSVASTKQYNSLPSVNAPTHLPILCIAQQTIRPGFTVRCFGLRPDFTEVVLLVRFRTVRFHIGVRS
jgi:hypothetical protein